MSSVLTTPVRVKTPTGKPYLPSTWDTTSSLMCIRYLRLAQVDMATIVCAMPFVLPLAYFMMKRLSGSPEDR